MNYDASSNNNFTRTVSTALELMGLVSVWQDNPIDFTHVHTDGVRMSKIDHFLVTRRLLGEVVDCGLVHSGDNLSRHSPIILRLRLGEVRSKQAAAQPTPRRMPAWVKATGEEIHNHTSALNHRLTEMKCPESLHCKDSHSAGDRNQDTYAHAPGRGPPTGRAGGRLQ